MANSDSVELVAMIQSLFEDGRYKTWVVAVSAFVVPAGMAYLALPQDEPISSRSIVMVIVTGLVAMGNSVIAYNKTHPSKTEIPKPVAKKHGGEHARVDR